jgi:D-proline reductase (dithiol) PrdB
VYYRQVCPVAFGVSAGLAFLRTCLYTERTTNPVTPEERELYNDWLARRRPLLEAKQWTEAMRDVPRLTDLQPAVPQPLRRPLDETTVALVTSAAITQPRQPPMDGPNIEGDYTIRPLDIHTPTSELSIWHTHFDLAAALEDINVVYPIDRLNELAADGTIGRVANPAVSFMGYFTNVFRIRDEVAPAVVDAVLKSGADAALLVPV